MIKGTRSSGYLYFGSRERVLVNGTLSKTPGTTFYQPGGLGVMRAHQPILVPFKVNSVYQVKPIFTKPNEKYKVQTRPDSHPVVSRWANMFGPEVWLQSQAMHNYMVDRVPKSSKRKKELEGHGEAAADTTEPLEESEMDTEASDSEIDQSEAGEGDGSPSSKKLKPLGKKGQAKAGTVGKTATKKANKEFPPKKRNQLKTLINNPVKMDTTEYKKSLAKNMGTKIHIQDDDE